jgi:NTE family protein
VGPRHLADLGPGEIVGELAVLTGEARSATVTALDDTTLRVLDSGSVEAELAKLSPWVGRILTRLAERFARLNERVAGHETGAAGADAAGAPNG